MLQTKRKLQIIGNYAKHQHIQSRTQRECKNITKEQPSLDLKNRAVWIFTCGAGRRAPNKHCSTLYNVCKIKNNKLCKISKAMPAITVWGLSLLESWFTMHLKQCELWAYEKILTLINTHFSAIMGYDRISWVFYSYSTLSYGMKLWVLYLQISTFINVRVAACSCSEQNMSISHDPCSWRVFYIPSLQMKVKPNI